MQLLRTDVIASQCAHWRGNPFPFSRSDNLPGTKRSTDCHVASLLAMTWVIVNFAQEQFSILPSVSMQEDAVCIHLDATCIHLDTTCIHLDAEEETETEKEIDIDIEKETDPGLRPLPRALVAEMDFNQRRELALEKLRNYPA